MRGHSILVITICWMLFVGNVPATVFYVDVNSTNPVPPYANWSTAATDIQSAIDASSDGDLIWVKDGVYQTGGRPVNGYALTNRVVINKAVSVQSVNGPAVTMIQGYQVPGTTNGDSAVRCVYLTNNAALIGFTLTNGATRLDPADELNEASGGGVWCENTNSIISNCILTVNAADYTYGLGGGAVSGTLSGCTLSGNSAAAGGGSYSGTLNGCLLISNWVSSVGNGGGARLSVLNYCTLAGNSAPGFGAAASCTLNYCVVTNNSSSGNGGGVGSCTAFNCNISGNAAGGSGGGSYISMLTNCALADNTAVTYGGGAYEGALHDCNLSSNSAASFGGGTYSATLVNCSVTGNSAASGGGADLGTLINCTISGNFAFEAGGGVNTATLDGCALTGNSTVNNGGGAAGSVLSSCTLAGNSALSGGGIYSSSLTNCIVYYNNASAGANYSGGTFINCCTTPAPTSGFANITADPLFADSYHLSAESPCIGAGNSAYVSGVDIDGEPWANPPAIGCDEFYTAGQTGPLSVAIQAAYTNLATGFSGGFTAQINGHATISFWDFGDGNQVTNEPYISHTWTNAGNYQVSLLVFNQSNPAGVDATQTIHVMNQPTQYVALANASPAAPFESWGTAATNIQDAIDVAYGGGLILVSNGVYNSGGRVVHGSLSNRVVINKAVTVQSVNGPAATVIQGYQVPGGLVGDAAIRCVYLINGAMLAGFTLTNGATRYSFSSDKIAEQSGGGAWCESPSGLISNCIVSGNSCFWYGAGVYSGTLNGCQISNNTNLNSSQGGGGGAAYSALLNSTISSNNYQNGGGGAYSCNLSNCVITGNSVGGVLNCVLNNCTLQGNTAINYSGGGASGSTLNNCVLFNNQAGNGGGAYDCALNFCTVSNNTASSAGGSGGGVYCDTYQTVPPGQNNILVGNSAFRFGGGFYLTVGLSGFTNWNLSNWIFTSNSAASDGGGLYISSGKSALNNCNFTGNSSGGNGGGFSSVSPNMIGISNGNFIGNIAVGNGGGAYLAAMNNCLIVGNMAANGGGVYGAVSNCVINNNIAKTNGGGAYTTGSSSACYFTNNLAVNGGGSYGGYFSNCTFAANSAISNGGATYVAALSHCLIISNQAAFGGGASYGGDSIPLVPGTQDTYVDCNFFNNSATVNGGGIYTPSTVILTMINCLLENNSAQGNGGGEYEGALIRCTVSQNSAGTSGGGAYGGTLGYCIISGNTVLTNGGGTYGSSIVNCLLDGNSAAYGGGAYNGGFNNSTIVNNTATSSGGGAYFTSGGQVVSCIVYDNYAAVGANYTGLPLFNYCCTTPLIYSSYQSITNDPAFINLATGNYRLQTNSPCINVGNGNPGSTDLDGRPRVVGGRIDIGAYEFQGPGMGEFIGWLQQYGLPTDGSVDYADLDGTGMNNWQKWIAGLNPTNAASVLALYPPATTNTTGITVTWQSVNTRTYYLQSTTNLPAFTSVQSNIVGQAGTTSYTDTTATNGGPHFYRVGVQ